MKLVTWIALILAMVCLISPALRSGTQDGEAAARAELAQLDWLEGTWEGSQGGVWHQEVWRKAKGGMMLGLHHEVQEATDRTLSFEYLRIEARADGLYYVASPMGRPSTSFSLTQLEERSAVFANEGHDFPQRITYERQGEELVARVEGKGGKPLSWRWTRVP